MSDSNKNIQELDVVTIRFAGDSGDGMQLTGNQFSDNTALFGNEYKYCVSGSSLYIYYFTEILGTLTEVAYGTYTMTSDSTYHKLSEPYCTCGPNYTSDTCNEECQNSNPWRHCTIYHYGPDPED